MEQSIGKGVVNPWKVRGGVKSNPIPPRMILLELIQVSTDSAPEAQGWESTVAAKALTAPQEMVHTQRQGTDGQAMQQLARTRGDP